MDYMRCICGEETACFHKECLALLTPYQRRHLDKTGKIIEDPLDRHEQ